jgi:hypothetical protein
MIDMEETIVEIPPGSGNRYRYGYDPGKKVMVYLGPVGDAPAIMSEEQFEAINEEGEMTIERFTKITGWNHYDVEAFFAETGIKDKGIKRVIASSEGDNDGDDWIILAEMDNGRFAFASAGCCYTGWECHASGYVEYYTTYEEAVHPLNLTDENASRFEIER